MRIRFSMIAVLAACGGAGSAPSTSHPLPANECTCDQLQAPPVVPADPAARAHWERTADGIAAALHDLALLFPDRRCAEGVQDAVARVLRTHADVIRDDRVLNDATCDAFGRWQTEQGAAVGSDITTIAIGMRWCIHLSNDASRQLGDLMILRGCTRVE